MLKRKIATTLLVCIIGLNSGFLSFANTMSLGESEDSYDDFSIGREIIDTYGEFIGNMPYDVYLKFIGDENNRQKRSIPGIVEEKRLYLTHYKQGDSRWANEKLFNSSVTIGRYGCAVSSLAILLSKFGYSDTPLDVNNKLKPYITSGADMQWYQVKNAYAVDLSYFKRVNYTTIEDCYNYIRGQIRQDKPVIVGMRKNEGHFVTVNGILETAYDPEAGTVDKKTVMISDPGHLGYSSLEDYLDDGYTIRVLIGFE